MKTVRYHIKKKPTKAEQCKATQPWKAATGPRTPDGKAASAQNALKHGMRSAEVLRLLSLLAEQNRYLDRVCPLGRIMTACLDDDMV